MWGGELVLRDGVAVGQVRSAAWGATVGAAVGLAYVRRRDGDAVTRDYLRTGEYAVDVGGARVPGHGAPARALRPGQHPHQGVTGAGPQS